jgi:hypothetical protein
MDVACVALEEKQGKREIENAGFGREVLGNIRNDDCGWIAKPDRLVLRVGLYYHRKVTRRNYHLLMTHIHRLGLLLIN